MLEVLKRCPSSLLLLLLFCSAFPLFPLMHEFSLWAVTEAHPLSLPKITYSH